MICVLLNCSTQLIIVTAMDVEGSPKVSCCKVLFYVLGLPRITTKDLQ